MMIQTVITLVVAVPDIIPTTLTSVYATVSMIGRSAVSAINIRIDEEDDTYNVFDVPLAFAAGLSCELGLANIANRSL